MIVTLPKPPTINTYYGHNRYTGQKYMGRAGKDWLEEAGYIIKQRKTPFMGELSIYINLYYCGRFDWDNGNKPIGDLLKKQGWIGDDEQIMFAQVQKVKVKHRSEQKVVVEIPEL